MDINFKRHMLNRITSLMDENKEVKEKNKQLIKAYNLLLAESEQHKKQIEKAEELSRVEDHSRPVQKRFDAVTILHVEVQGFSNIVASDLTEHMDQLDQIFLQFNSIAKKYQLLKLYAVGDTFICAGGIPEKDNTNPITVTLAALEMLHIIASNTQDVDDHAWSIHIGIHTGSVNALVTKKGQSPNEIKGDTMNVASRIGSIGIKNTIVVSATTYELIKELFDYQYISSLPVKYQSKIELFTITGIKAGFVSDNNCFLPNDMFRVQVMLIRFSDLQEFILDKLEKELPGYLYYHNVKHTVDVVTGCELIGWAEGLTDYQLLLLKTAALFHDTGHTISYVDHEERSVDIARNILPSYHYHPEEINEICRIIMATKLPPKPADLLESIICDSDLDYLGRTDFIPVSNSLYEELKAQGKMSDINAWNKMQLSFIGSHQYFTKTARKLREVKKQEQIERIRQLIVC